MCLRDLVCECEHEASVVLDLLWCRLPLEQLDRLTQMLQPVLPELLDRVVARVVALGLRRDDFVQYSLSPCCRRAST